MTVQAARPSRPTRRARPTGWVPFAFVALVLILVPAVTGSARLVEVFGGPHLMPYNPRIVASPLPVIVHLVSVIPYAIVGAFQFSSRLRRVRPGWHRMAGRALIPLGLLVAASGLWMTLFYPTQAGTGVLLYVVRLAVGSTMAASILLGLAAIRRGDVPRHLAWMTRAYALALGAGTQAFTGAVRDALLGSSVLANDASLTAAWVINLAVAEFAIRRSRAVRPQRAAALTGG